MNIMHNLLFIDSLKAEYRRFFELLLLWFWPQRYNLTSLLINTHTLTQLIQQQSRWDIEKVEVNRAKAKGVGVE